DLVNEILETWIAAQALPPSPGGPLPVETAGYNDTGGAAEDELRAFPQYIADQPAGAPDNRGAQQIYDFDEQGQGFGALRSRAYPLTLPFNLAHETARAYLAQLGTSLHEVLTTTQSADDPAATLATCIEYLKLPPDEYRLLTTTVGLANYYG